MSQSRHVEITRLHANNSHDSFREARQIEKSLVDLASRLRGEETKQLLVELLNAKNHQVRAAHESEDGQRLLAGRDVLPEDEEFPDVPREPKAPLSPAAAEEERRAVQAAIALVGMSRSQPAAPAAPAVKSTESSESGTDDDSETSSQASQGENEDDEEEYLDPSNVKSLDEKYKELSRLERELADPNELALRQLLLLDPSREYEIKDLDERPVLLRGIRLLLKQRFGQGDEGLALGPHISYHDLRQDEDLMALSLATIVAKKGGKETGNHECITPLSRSGCVHDARNGGRVMKPWKRSKSPAAHLLLVSQDTSRPSANPSTNAIDAASAPETSRRRENLRRRAAKIWTRPLNCGPSLLRGLSMCIVIFVAHGADTKTPLTVLIGGARTRNNFGSLGKGSRKALTTTRRANCIKKYSTWNGEEPKSNSKAQSLGIPGAAWTRRSGMELEWHG